MAGIGAGGAAIPYGGTGGGGDAAAPEGLTIEQRAFNNVMGRIGFNADARQTINNEGFRTLDDLLNIAEDQIDKLVKHVGHWRNANLPNTSFPFLCIQKLEALRLVGIATRPSGRSCEC